MQDLKISVGVWYLGATSDRFVKQGYRPDRTMEERFKLAASIPGAGGLEMHYPTEVTDQNYKFLKQLADDLGLKIVQFCPHLWVDPRWKFGQFTNPDEKLRREAIELRNSADSLAYSAEKTLRDNADKVPDDLKTEVEGKIAAVRTALQGEDTNAIRTAADELSASMQAIGQAVYGSAGAEGSPSPDGADEGAPEGTVEGEFREV